MYRRTFSAQELDTQTVVERASMPFHPLIKTDKAPVNGRLIFKPVIKKGEGWVIQDAEVLIEPNTRMVIIESYRPEKR